MPAVMNCSFCLKSSNEVAKLIAGPAGVYICDGCVDLCNRVLADDGAKPPFSTGAA